MDRVGRKSLIAPAAFHRGGHEPFLDAAVARKRWTPRRADVAWYRSVVTTGPVLELGVGYGRVARALIGDGWSVVGVDRSAPLLEDARRRLPADRFTGLLSDVASLDLGSLFPVVLAPFHVLNHAEDGAALQHMLRRVRAHLHPDGLFAFDLRFPTVWTGPPRRTVGTLTRRGVRIPWEESTVFDVRQQRELSALRIGDQPAVCLAHRYVMPAELEDHLNRAGLRVTGMWGGFAGEALGDGPSIVVTAT